MLVFEKDNTDRFASLLATAGERLRRRASELMSYVNRPLRRQNQALLQKAAELEARNAELTRQREDLATANVRLRELATTDGLTGLVNHRSFAEQLENEIARHRRFDAPLSLIMVDVDHFKGYNDTYGHQAGDDALRAVALLLKRTARDTDVVARYGGEEFAIIAHATDSDGAARLADRLREAIEFAPWRERGVTASFGVATVEPFTAIDDDSRAPSLSSDLIDRADTALYRSKENGRNRVSAYHELMGERQAA